MKDLVTGLQHIGLPTVNLEETTRFYTQLGFALVHEARQPDGGLVRFLRLAQVTVEAWQAPSACGATGAIDHIALNVTDVDAVFAYVRAHVSCRFLHDAPCSLPYWERGVRFFTVEGPNGERIEFAQYL